MPQDYVKMHNGLRKKRFVFSHTPSLEPLSPKFKRVSLIETPKFPFWGLKIWVDFDLTNSNKMENVNKRKKIIFHSKNTDIHKTA